MSRPFVFGGGAVAELLAVCNTENSSPGWRNWQTQRTQNPPGRKPLGGSTPPPGTRAQTGAFNICTRNRERPATSDLTMTGVWETLKSYFWWSYERGGLHYDVMVTLILVFVFLSPLVVNFNDKPVERMPHPTRVVLLPDGNSGYIYQIDAAAVAGANGSVKTRLQRVIEPIAGEVEVARYEEVRDSSGHVVAYKVWVQRSF